MENLGQKIKAFRASKGMSMPVFASIVGVPKERIYKWEKGVTPYMTNEVQSILDYIENGIVPQKGANLSESILRERQEVYESKGYLSCRSLVRIQTGSHPPKPASLRRLRVKPHSKKPTAPQNE